MAAGKDPSTSLGMTRFTLLLLWAVVWAVMAMNLPLLPVDETRYLTVAWEMHLSHHWLLPTLNGEPYSHKPPLLFWLINLIWSVTGPQLWAARLLPGIVTGVVLLLTARLARVLFPDRPLVAHLAPLLLLSCPAFLVYGNLIMFDLLLTCFVLLALERLWRAAQMNDFKHWLYFGLFTGLGVLAKGPVVALYVLFPALLLPFFTPLNKKRWYLGVLAGLGIATLIGLAWAVPAAMQGGHDFAQMLFVKQSAGRMVESFAHRRPPWFYLPFVPAFCIPLMFWPPFWRALKNGRDIARAPQSKLLIVAALGPFIAFSFISGKQVHYLLPLLPSAAILLAALFARAAERSEIVAPPRDIAGPILFFVLLLVAALLAPRLPPLLQSHDRLIAATLHDYHAVWFAVAAALAIFGAYNIRQRGLIPQLTALAAGLILLLGAGALQAGRTALPFVDLRPIAAALQPYKDRPLAYAAKYAGELGYLARLERPLELIDPDAIPGWFAAHPDGIVIVRHASAQPAAGGLVIRSFPYKGDQTVELLEKPVRQAAVSVQHKPLIYISY